MPGLPEETSTAASTLTGVEFTADAGQTLRPLRWIFSTAAILAICVGSFWVAANPEWILRFGTWGYIGAFLISLVASATIILPAPGIAVVIAMGTALDPILLGVVAGIGSAFGEMSGYLAGAGGRALIPAHRRSQFEQLHTLAHRHGASLLFLLAAVPFPLFDFAGIIAGMMRMRVATFIAAVGLGKSIKYVLLILLGAAPLLFLQERIDLFFGGG